MLTKQDIKIIQYLLEYDQLSVYSLAKHTKISQPQIRYRLKKMVDCGFVKTKTNSGRGYFVLHPLMINEQLHEKILRKFLEICHLFEQKGDMNLESLRYYLEFFMFSIREDDNNNSSPDKQFKELNYQESN